MSNNLSPNVAADLQAHIEDTSAHRPIATQAEARTGTDNTKIMTPALTKEAIENQKRSIATFADAQALTNRTRVMTPLLTRHAIEGNRLPIASQSQAETGTENEKRMTPLRTKQAIDAQRPIATQAEAETGTSNTKVMTPLRTKEAIEGNRLPVATEAEAEAGIDNSKLMTPARTRHAIEGNRLSIATSAEAEAGVDNANRMTPARTRQAIDAQRPIATQGEAETGTDNTKVMTPLRTKEVIDAQWRRAEVLEIRSMMENKPSAVDDNDIITIEALRWLREAQLLIPLGALLWFPDHQVRWGWRKCTGQILSRANHPALYEIIGSQFILPKDASDPRFSGPNPTHYRIPDYRGCFLRMRDIRSNGRDPGRGFNDFQDWAIENITGSFWGRVATPTGAFGSGGNRQNQSGPRNPGHPLLSPSHITQNEINFDASRQVKTATETRPANYAATLCIRIR